MAEPRLTHVDDSGAARMVDVSDKQVSTREAVAAGRVLVSAEVVALLRGAGVPKGDTLAVARLAGIMAAKRTADLIPLCHPLTLSHVDVELAPDARGARVTIESRVRTRGPTGVEMEALAAVTIAALALYDMCKAVDRGMTLDAIRLVRKSGGRSGTWTRRGER